MTGDHRYLLTIDLTKGMFPSDELVQWNDGCHRHLSQKNCLAFKQRKINTIYEAGFNSSPIIAACDDVTVSRSKNALRHMTDSHLQLPFDLKPLSPEETYKTTSTYRLHQSHNMGLPQQPNNASSFEPQPSTSTARPTKASDLPPEALELATKMFQYARTGATNELLQYVSAGIPANLTNHKGDTLVMLAAYHGHADTVRMLLQRGADPNALNDRGQSPIAGAVFKAEDEVVKALFEGMNGNKADIRAGQPNAVDSARMFKKENYLALFGVQDDMA